MGGSSAGAPSIGVLALQGGFEAHQRMLRGLGAKVREVRTPADLDGLDGLVIPGGESTTMTLGIQHEGLAAPLRELVLGLAPQTEAEIGARPGDGRSDDDRVGEDHQGIPVLGSCAGLIMLDRDHLGLMDMRAQRNAFGRQSRSFETDLDLADVPGGPLRAVFIRAPWIAEHGPDVQILAAVDGHPVAARQGSRLAVAFHSELTDDDRVHRLFLEQIPR